MVDRGIKRKRKWQAAEVHKGERADVEAKDKVKRQAGEERMEDGGREQQKELNYHWQTTDRRQALFPPVPPCVKVFAPNVAWEKTWKWLIPSELLLYYTGFELISAERGREFSPRQPETDCWNTLCRPHQLPLISTWSGLCLPHQLIRSSKLFSVQRKVIICHFLTSHVVSTATYK